MANYASKVIAIAKAEVGYLEKKTGEDLYNKTANAGSENYTKYNYEMNQIYPAVMDYPAAWCGAFCCWCLNKAYGTDEAKKLLCGNFNDYTPQLAAQFKTAGQWSDTPEVGDLIFFKNSKRICHVGLVQKVTDSTVYTVEGNTSSAAGVVSNGGCVREKSYPIGYASIAGYGRPAYDKEVTGNENVRKFQQYLNKNYNGGLVEDGEYGAKTKKAALKAMQMYLNKSLGARLAVDGVWGPKTVAVVTKCVLNRGDRGNAVYILQGMMYCAGYDPNGFDGIYGAGCQASVKKYQKAKGLSVDGVVGKQVWTALFA